VIKTHHCHLAQHARMQLITFFPISQHMFDVVKILLSFVERKLHSDKATGKKSDSKMKNKTNSNGSTKKKTKQFLCVERIGKHHSLLLFRFYLL
jgi:hypothetical protein